MPELCKGIQHRHRKEENESTCCQHGTISNIYGKVGKGALNNMYKMLPFA